MERELDDDDVMISVQNKISDICITYNRDFSLEVIRKICIMLVFMQTLEEFQNSSPWSRFAKECGSADKC